VRVRRLFGLLGLFVLGIVLLFNPTSGLLGVGAEGVAVDSAAGAVVTTGAPPPDDTVGGSQPPATSARTTSTSGRSTDPSTNTTTTTPVTGSLVVTGPAVSTRFGPFQVEAVIEGGQLVEVTTLREPGDRRSQSINNRALPVYEAAAIDAQSADFDAISGATITWDAYTSSLQAALDEVGL
jgi:uncharacterized protein with FMN-binding domain